MKLGDRLNPVALKELRQVVRSRLIASGLIGYLGVALIAVAIILLSAQSNLGKGESLGDQNLGLAVFNTIYVILSLLLTFAMPFFIGFRMAAERSNEHLDLQYTTALKPRQLIDGKVAAAFAIVFLFISASLPFLSLAYLLRGLDLLRVLQATLLLLCIAVACIYEALFLATAANNRILRVMLLLVMLSVQGIITSSTIGGGIAILDWHGLSFATWSEAALPLLLLFGLLSGCILLRTLTIALVMPASANRAPAIRRWLTLLLLAWGGIAWFSAREAKDIDFLMAWGIVASSATALFSLISISTPPGYSRRILAAVAPSRWRRCCQFFSFSGSLNGLLWSLLLMLMVFVVVGCAEAWHDQLFASSANRSSIKAMHIFAYSFTLQAYIWSLYALWRQARLQRWLSWRLAGPFAVALTLLGWLLPYLATLGAAGPLPTMIIGNPFAAFSENTQDTILIATVAALWFITAFLLNLPAIREAIRDFKPLAVVDAPPPPHRNRSRLRLLIAAFSLLLLATIFVLSNHLLREPRYTMLLQNRSGIIRSSIVDYSYHSISDNFPAEIRTPLEQSVVAWPDAVHYFRYLMSDESAESAPLEAVICSDPAKRRCGNLTTALLAGAGVPAAPLDDLFSQAHCAWHVCLIDNDSPGGVPFLISKNVNLSAGRLSLTGSGTNLVSLADKAPLGTSRAVWITKDGTPHMARAGELTEKLLLGTTNTIEVLVCH